MDFNFILRENKYNFKEAKEIFLDMTDTQRLWISSINKRNTRKADLKGRLSSTRNRVFKGRKRR